MDDNEWCPTQQEVEMAFRGNLASGGMFELHIPSECLSTASSGS